MTKSKIGWTKRVWNPVVGCSPVGEGCRHCYAEKQAARLERMGQTKYRGLTRGGKWNGNVRVWRAALGDPLQWPKTPTLAFTASMGDVFHDDVGCDDLDMMFAVMAATPHVTYQVLTKRPENAVAYQGRGPSGIIGAVAWNRRRPKRERRIRGLEVDAAKLVWPLQNVWIGASVEDPESVRLRVPLLRECPAALRFLSCEPLLGEIGLDLRGIGWVIVGGESGLQARRCDARWIESVVEQCRAAGVPCFVKQLGARPDIGGDDFYRCPKCGYIEGVDGFDILGADAGNCFCIGCSEEIPWTPHTITAPKGDDPAEWPEGLRVQETPTIER